MIRFACLFEPKMGASPFFVCSYFESVLVGGFVVAKGIHTNQFITVGLNYKLNWTTADIAVFNGFLIALA